MGTCILRRLFEASHFVPETSTVLSETERPQCYRRQSWSSDDDETDSYTSDEDTKWCVFALKPRSS